jgi:hypothetical protein
MRKSRPFRSRSRPTIEAKTVQNRLAAGPDGAGLDLPRPARECRTQSIAPLRNAATCCERTPPRSEAYRVIPSVTGLGSRGQLQPPLTASLIVQSVGSAVSRTPHHPSKTDGPSFAIVSSRKCNLLPIIWEPH